MLNGPQSGFDRSAPFTFSASSSSIPYNLLPCSDCSSCSRRQPVGSCNFKVVLFEARNYCLRFTKMPPPKTCRPILVKLRWSCWVYKSFLTQFICLFFHYRRDVKTFSLARSYLESVGFCWSTRIKGVGG